MDLIFHSNGIVYVLVTSWDVWIWNKSRPSPFKWYIDQNFNSVEINASFYRFPTENWIKTWRSTAPKNFTFSIKVHRSITHYTRLKCARSLKLWKRFSNTFELMEDKMSVMPYKCDQCKCGS